MAKIISYSNYEQIYKKIKEYFNKNLYSGSKEIFYFSFSRVFNKIFPNKASSLQLKSSCRDLISRGDYDAAIKKMIIWRYTRKESLILDSSDGTRVLYRQGILVKEIK